MLPMRKSKSAGELDESSAKVAAIWSGIDPNVISATKCKRRVRRAWPSLASALDEMEKNSRD